MKLPDVRRRRKNEANESRKGMESKEHLLAHLELPDTMRWNGARTHGEK